MAWSLVGDEQDSGNSATADVTHGLTINSGDLVVAYLNVNGPETITADDAGWTEAINEEPSGETAQHALYWKEAGGSEPSSYSWSLGGSNTWRAIVKVFRGNAGPEVDAAAFSTITSINRAAVDCEAADGIAVSAGAVSVVFGGKDNRNNSSEPYINADQGFTGAIGDRPNQLAAGAHRVFSSATTITEGPDITPSDGNDGVSDKVYSVHISFVEDSGGATVAVGLASETDTAFSLGKSIVKSVGQASETDTAFSVGAAELISIGLASEVVSAFSVGFSRSKAIGLASETDTAFSVGAAELVSIGLALETDTAFTVSESGTITQSIGLATESDTALALAFSKLLGIGLSSETDTANSVTPVKPVTIGLASETDQSFSISFFESLAIGVAVEEDSALALASGGIPLNVDQFTTINDIILQVVSANLLDGLRDHYLVNGASSGDLMDLERQFLVSALGSDNGETLHDLWMKALENQGYTSGSFDDRLREFWKNEQGVFTF